MKTRFFVAAASVLLSSAVQSATLISDDLDNVSNISNGNTLTGPINLARFNSGLRLENNSTSNLTSSTLPAAGFSGDWVGFNGTGIFASVRFAAGLGNFGLTSGQALTFSFNYSGLDSFEFLAFTPPPGGNGLFIEALVERRDTPALLGTPTTAGLYEYTFTPTNPAGVYGFRMTGDAGFAIDNPLLANAVVVSAVPEPGEWAMMLAGLGVVSAIARKRKAKASH
jgi:hypothetical protein